MFHKFLEDGDWFAPKRFGYGAGLPIAWQGWALLLAYIAVMGALGLLLNTNNLGASILAGTGMAMATILVIAVSKKRTKGGWRWRQ